MEVNVVCFSINERGYVFTHFTCLQYNIETMPANYIHTVIINSDYESFALSKGDTKYEGGQKNVESKVPLVLLCR